MTPSTTAEARVESPAEPAASATEPEARAAIATPAPAGPLAPYGSLVIEATWGKSGEPAGDVAIIVRALDEPLLPRDVLQVVTDADGRATLERVHAGEIRVSSDRGGSMTIELEAGGERNVAFEVPPGIPVEGRVVDARGEPVASAGIWMTTGEIDWLGGRIVARSANDGAFRIQNADPKQSLGALAEGYERSELVDLEGVRLDEHPDLVTLIVARSAATIEGRVLARTGEPVAGALVAIGRRGKTDWRRDGSVKETWTPEVLTTDDGGRFRSSTLAAGETRLSARADGFALASDLVTLHAGETTEHVLVLERGVTIHGIVTDDDGEPVQDAEVTALDRPLPETKWVLGPMDSPNVFGRATARTHTDGSYTLANVRAGTIELFASSGDVRFRVKPYHGRDQTTREASADETLEWNPVLSLGGVIRGRVESAGGGTPWVWTQIHATPEEEGAKSFGTLYDDEGHFLFAHLDPVPYTLSITSPGAEVTLEGVWPGTEDVVLTLPYEDPSEWSTVEGRFVDAGERVGPGELQLMLDSGSGWFAVAEVEGEHFEFDEIEPGRYRLVAMAELQTVHVGTWFEVLPGTPLDLGTIETTSAAGLEVRLVSHDGAPIAKAFVRHRGGLRQPSAATRGRPLAGARPAPRSPPLERLGRWRVRASHRSGADRRRADRVEA